MAKKYVSARSDAELGLVYQGEAPEALPPCFVVRG